jgi:hypothetical protein
MSISSRLFRLVIVWLVGVGMMSTLVSSPLQASPHPAQEIELNGVLADVGFYPLVANGKTDIAVAVCASSNQFQLRSEQPGVFMTGIFVRATVCPPRVAKSWRAVVGAVPGERFIVYVWAADVFPDEANFMARATRYSVTVTALGQLTVQRIPHVAMTGNWEDPGAGATIQGTVNLKGWLVDLANWNSAGIDQVELYHNATLLGAVSYGIARPDVAAVFGDSRYTNAGFSYNLDTTRLPNGVQTLSIRYRSAAFEQWQQLDRQFNVSNVVAPPSDTTPPDGRITAPGESAIIGRVTTITAEATDNTGGSGVARVDFFAAYNGQWVGIGRDTTAPYQAALTLPTDTASQLLLLTIHVYDNAGNLRMDPGGYRPVGYIASTNNTGVRENWVPKERRAYLNQRALGSNGDVMCSMASIAMVRAMAGLIGRDATSMAAEAQRAWNSGLRGPGIRQVRAYLQQNGMQAGEIWSQGDNHWNRLKAEIDAGWPVILNSPSNSDGGAMTNYGHYIVVVGYAEGGNQPRRVIAYDPFGEWKGTNNSYNRNDESHNEPNGAKGRWKYYAFDALGKVYSVTARSLSSPSSPQMSSIPSSLPDPMVVDADETIAPYEGHNQIPNDFKVYIPTIRR